MLSVTQLDFANYWRSFKGNYSKGIRNLANILQTPQQATDLAKNLGGVSVLLGTPVGEEDVNSLQLRTMLLESPYADTAVETWLKGHYTFDTLHDLFSDSTVRAEVFNSELLWRSVSMSSVAMAMYIGDIVSLDPEEYGDMQAVAASTVAMQAVAASTVAMQAVINSPTALNAVVNSYVAVAAIWMNSSAVTVVKANSSAWAVFSNPSSAVIGKAVCVIVGLNPNSYADMQAVAASSTAMQAVAASSTAMQAVAASSTAISACMNQNTARAALIAQNTILQSVANTWFNTVSGNASKFPVIRAQEDYDDVTSANSVGTKYICFAIPGGYNSGSGVTNCFHGQGGSEAGSASGSYTDTSKRKVLIGGGTFTENGDGVVRTWVYNTN